MALLIRANGEVDEVHPDRGNFSICDLNQFVGGYIEQLPNPCVPAGKQVFCNKDSEGLPYNSTASNRYSMPIYGDVIECTLAETGDDY